MTSEVDNNNNNDQWSCKIPASAYIRLWLILEAINLWPHRLIIIITMITDHARCAYIHLKLILEAIIWPPRLISRKTRGLLEDEGWAARTAWLSAPPRYAGGKSNAGFVTLKLNNLQQKIVYY